MSSTEPRNLLVNSTSANEQQKTDDQMWDDLLQSPEGQATLKSLADEADEDFENGDFEED